MSESHKGKKQSESSKNKMRGKNNKKSKPIAQYDLNNNLIKTYACIREASEENNINYSTLRTYLQRNKSYNLSGFIWKYHEEVN